MLPLKVRVDDILSVILYSIKYNKLDKNKIINKIIW
mgnify:CR=1 FL=1